ncbi:MAG: single-stranded-DNA-specific exonuclease RecJ, partial [Anaerolineae bacterium]|nr:single-stranded-DNA-specific exonuclease RecJ [Anaerolineae bacterium]
MLFRWLDPNPVSVPEEVQAFVGGRPLVAETLVRRGIDTVAAARDFMDPDAHTPAPSSDFPDMARAVARLSAALQRRERICVWGDFDVDGQTSTTLLVATLRDLGGDVFHHIPVRATESHGVNVPNLQVVIDAGARVLLTCDTGVSAHEAVEVANRQGVDVVITDHHELPDDGLPAAHAIVNPHRLPEGHPLATLPGVGVAYKLAQALYVEAGREGEARKHLDLVALGIVADVAELAGDTRYLLQRGLPALRETKRRGLRALFELARVDPRQLNEETIGFSIGPRLNALGRLADANVIVEFFTTEDWGRARILAGQLDALNNERKRLCNDVEQGALTQIERDPALLDDAALVLSNPHWPGGVIGIVASRLSERFNRPVVLLSAPQDAPAHGSARSVEGCHITEAIATQRALLIQFGGHAMAAGLSLPAEAIPAFRRGLSRSVQAQRGTTPPKPSLQIDGYVALEALSLDLIHQLDRLAPFGPGNPPLTLAVRDVSVAHHTSLGRTGDHLAVIIEDAKGASQRVLWWRAAADDLPVGRFDLAFSVRANTFRGEQQVQVVWVDTRPVPQAATVLEAVAPILDIADYRREPHPLTLVQPMLAWQNTQVWAEMASTVPGVSREDLRPAETLVIWTAPPGPQILRHAMERVTPRRVIVFGVDPGIDRFDPFLKRLAGLVKYAVNFREGRAPLLALAAATSQRLRTVRKGLAWLAARGYIVIERWGEDAVVVCRPTPAVTTVPVEGTGPLDTELRGLLEETAAYRKHFVRADVGALFE